MVYPGTNTQESRHDQPLLCLAMMVMPALAVDIPVAAKTDTPGMGVKSSQWVSVRTRMSILSALKMLDNRRSLLVSMLFFLLVQPCMFQVPNLKQCFLSLMGGGMPSPSSPSVSLPSGESGLEAWGSRGGVNSSGTLLVLRARLVDARRRGVSHEWLLLALTAPTPARGVPAVPPPSPSVPQP
jgi:hypothetical protein